VTAFNRTQDTFLATLPLNENNIIQADHSASIRIVPFIILSKMVSLQSLEGFFGHGIDYVSTFLSDYIPSVPDEFKNHPGFVSPALPTAGFTLLREKHR